MERHCAPKMGKGLRKQPIGITENVGAHLVCLKISQMRQDYPRAASDVKKEGDRGNTRLIWPPLLGSFGRGGGTAILLRYPNMKSLRTQDRRARNAICSNHRGCLASYF